jgi:hypothetical protein
MTSSRPLISSPIPPRSLLGPAYTCHNLVPQFHLDLSQDPPTSVTAPQKQMISSTVLIPSPFRLHLSEAPPTPVTISRKRMTSSRPLITLPIPSRSLSGPAYTCHSLAEAIASKRTLMTLLILLQKAILCSQPL